MMPPQAQQHPATEEKAEASEHEHASLDEQDPPVTLRAYLCVAGALTAYFANVFSLVGSGIYSYQIGQALGDTTTITWISSLGQIVLSVAGPPVALAADLYGRKWLVVAATSFGCIGSIVMATASNMQHLIGGATLAAFGFCAQPLVLAVCSEVVPRHRRSMLQGLANATVGFAGVAGIFANGAFIVRNTDGHGFRYCFTLMACMYFIAAVSMLVSYRPTRARPESAKRISHHSGLLQIDWVGTGLLAAAIGPLMLGLVWLKNPYEASDPHFIGPVAVGSAFTLAFVLWEIFGRNDGLLHHALFASQNFAICLGLAFIEGLVFFAFTIWWPQLQSLVYEHNPLLVGCRYAAFFGGILVLSPLVGYLSGRWKDARYLTAAGFTAYLVALIGMTTAKVGSGHDTIVYAALAGGGFSAPLVLLIAMAQLAAPPELLGLASALILATRGVGGAVGNAAFSAIFNTQLSSRLPTYILGAAIPLGFNPQYAAALIGTAASGNMALLEGIPASAGLSPAVLAASFVAATKAFSDSFRFVFVLATPFCAVAVGMCFKLDSVRQLMTSRIDAPATELHTADSEQKM